MAKSGNEDKTVQSTGKKKTTKSGEGKPRKKHLKDEIDNAMNKEDSDHSNDDKSMDKDKKESKRKKKNVRREESPPRMRLSLLLPFDTLARLLAVYEVSHDRYRKPICFSVRFEINFCKFLNF